MTATTERATARPWRCDPDPYNIYVWGPNDEMICEMRGTGAGLDKRANAELIVSAVNDHDALVEKVRALAAKWDTEVKAKESNGEWAESVKRCRDELLRALGDGR